MNRYTDLVTKFKDQEHLMVAFILEQIGSEAKISLRSSPLFQEYLNDASSVLLMGLIKSTFSGATNPQSIHRRTIQGLSSNMGTGTHPAYIQKIRTAEANLISDLGIICSANHDNIVPGQVYLPLGPLLSLIYLHARLKQDHLRNQDRRHPHRSPVWSHMGYGHPHC